MFSEQEQATLGGLAFFHGSFSREAARQVVGASLFFLDALINKSILRHTAQDRYVMHELLNQQLMARQTDFEQRLDGIQERFAAYYLNLVASVEVMVNQSRQKEALAIVNIDLENVRAAWDWAVDQGKIGLLVPAVHSFAIFLEQLGRFREGLEIFQVLYDGLVKIQEKRSEAGCSLAAVKNFGNPG